MKPTLSLSLLVLFAAPVEAQAPKRKAAAVDPMRFDLVCRVTGSNATGKLTDGNANLPLRIGDYTRCRFDLRAERYCFAGCEDMLQVQAITQESITLVESLYPSRSIDKTQRVKTYSVISRRNGSHRLENEYYDSVLNMMVGRSVEDYQCTRAPFSGFPAARF
jgi:hypothetical protein